MGIQSVGAQPAAPGGVHPRLVDVVELAIQRTAVDFTVVEGLRTAERQRELVAKGASQTQNSLHLVQPDGYGRAVDLAPPGRRDPLGQLGGLPAAGRHRQACAAELGVPVEWGGDWKTFRTARISRSRAAGRRRHDRRRRAAGRAGRLARLRGGHHRGCRSGLTVQGWRYGAELANQRATGPKRWPTASGKRGNPGAAARRGGRHRRTQRPRRVGGIRRDAQCANTGRWPAG